METRRWLAVVALGMIAGTLGCSAEADQDSAAGEDEATTEDALSPVSSLLPNCADPGVMRIEAPENGIPAAHSTSPPCTVMRGRIRAMMIRLIRSVACAWEAETIT